MWGKSPAYTNCNLILQTGYGLVDVITCANFCIEKLGVWILLGFKFWYFPSKRLVTGHPYNTGCATTIVREYVFTFFFKIQKTRLFTFFWSAMSKKRLKNIQSIIHVFTLLHFKIANWHFRCKNNYTYHSLTHSLVDHRRWRLATADDHSTVFLLHCSLSCDISFSWM